MKVTLTFTLPDEREEMENALRGDDYKFAIENLDARLRSRTKYEGKLTIEVDEVRKWIREELGDV